MAEMELNERDCGNVDEPEQKRQKPNECANSANEVETKTITNIYYDCLERIFDFLDIDDLLMVANTCKRLQIAATAKFGDEYGNKRVELSLLNFNRPPVYLHDVNEISVTGLKFCLPFLRCFGSKITKLTACYLFQQSHDEYLLQYINQYCADTLTDISIRYKLKFLREAIGKPFKYVEKVEILRCHLSGESLPNFVAWFPGMRHLKVVGCLIEDTASINVHFLHLKHLKIYVRENFDDKERSERVMNIIQSNPQLQSLLIVSDFVLTLDALLSKIHGNSTITKLKVKIRSWQPAISANELECFVAEHPLMVKLILKTYRLTADDAINFVRQMKALKQIGFHVSGRSECDRIEKELQGVWKSEVVTNDGKFYIELKR